MKLLWYCNVGVTTYMTHDAELYLWLKTSKHDESLLENEEKMVDAFATLQKGTDPLVLKIGKSSSFQEDEE